MAQATLKLNPFDKAGILSKITFAWVLPFFKEGYKRPLQKEDLFQVRKYHSSVILGDLLQKNWDNENFSAKDRGQKPSFIRALFRSFGLSIFLLGVAVGLDRCFTRILQTLLLGGLIKYFNKDPGFTADYIGWLCATGIVICEVVKVALLNGSVWGLANLAMKIRVATCNLLYRKTLRLRSSALRQITVGQIVNLLSNDVNRFETTALYFHAVWYGPVQAIIITTILWLILGPSCFVAILFIIFNLPLQGFMSKFYSRLCLATALLTDERIGITNEVLNIMRSIKIYCWDVFFEDMVKESRRKEVNNLLKSNYYQAFIWGIYNISGKLALFSTLLVYILLGNSLTTDKVFVAMVLIDHMNVSMTFIFFYAVTLVTETLISCDRIQKYLELEEYEDSDNVEKYDKQLLIGGSFVGILDASARWVAASGSDDLKRITFSVDAGQLLAIVGPVGSGKSTLLQVIMGELPINAGSIKIKGKIAYVSQEPWIINGTIKQNILFGQSFHARKYRQVIKVCALEKDLELLPDKDQTMVGEKGDALSGGQKARISLARAVYFDADVYLLDDPLSAVDAHVGGHLFHQCILSFLSKKVCILVTHQLQYLKSANQILVLENGVIQSKGTPESLKKQGMNLNTLICAQNDNEENLDLVKELPRPRSKSCWEMAEKSVPLSKITRFRRDSIAWNCLGFSNKPIEENIGEGILEISSGAAGGRRMTLIEDYELEDTIDTNKAGGDEIIVAGKLDREIYFKYFKAGGGAVFLSVLAVMFVAKQTAYLGVDYWLVYWLRHERESGKASLNGNFPEYNVSLANINNFLAPFVQHERDLYLYVYAGLIGALIIIAFVQSVLYARLCTSASKNLHKKMMSALIKTNMRFYDKHPVGQILNRFSNDLGKVDFQVPYSIYELIMNTLMCSGQLVIVSCLNAWILIHVFLIITVLWFLRQIYLSSAREIRRLEAIMRSPIFSHLSSSLQGLATIRSCGAQNRLIKEFEHHQDMHTSVWFLYLAMLSSFGLFLELLSIGLIVVTTFSFFVIEGEISGNEVGWSISRAFLFALMFVWGGRQSVEVEGKMISVERVLEYTKLDPEEPLEETKETNISEWPNAGNLSFQNVYLYYEKDEPPVLKNVNFNIQGGQKIGIVGRTGAGKSTLLTCLMRMVQPEGTIVIDNVNTDSISLNVLRESVSIIPQEPILFKGTVRQNLDPFSKYSDDKLWNVLEEIELKPFIINLPDGLSSLVTEGGDNFSIGQRQLFCLARAILKHNKILVMDEATADLDTQTDRKLQKTIRLKFAECTVLTIAHRINTIIDSDKVIVMDAGEVKEFSSPHELLQDNKSLFSELIRDTDADNENFLRKSAKKAYYSRQVDPNTLIRWPKKQSNTCGVQMQKHSLDNKIKMM